MTAIVCLGFWAPWIEWLGWGTRRTVWLWLGFELSGLGMSSTTGIELVTGLAILFSLLAFVLRVWGSACMGPAVVLAATMQAETLRVDGPYRWMRNPLYLGGWFMFLALAVLMPPSGAFFSVTLLTLFLLRLVLAEEAFLAARLGAAYEAYKRAVPRFIPSRFPRLAASGVRPAWARALLSEVMPLGVLVSFAALSWDYNSTLLIQAVLVSLGASIVARALLPAQPGNSQSAT